MLGELKGASSADAPVPAPLTDGLPFGLDDLQKTGGAQPSIGASDLVAVQLVVVTQSHFLQMTMQLLLAPQPGLVSRIGKLALMLPVQVFWWQ